MCILYIIYHEGFDAIKIGIGDIAGKRFRQHRTKGWKLVAYWYFKNRGEARRVESVVVNTLRAKHGSLGRNQGFLNKEDMPQSGYTETFNARKVKKRGLIRMVNKAIKG
jgi:hypothetical protein